MKRVLILDNDLDILDMMNEALSYEGLGVSCISNADNLFKAIAAYKPDVLMIDYLLNGANGGEICHNLKENLQTCNLPVILISAYPRSHMKLASDAFDDFITKPFDLDDMTARIKKLTGENKNRDSYAV